MILRRVPSRTALRALVALVLLLAVGTLPASAQDPPTDAVDTDDVDTDGVDTDDFELEPGEQAVHSFALTPAGATDPEAPSSRANLAYTGEPGAVIEDQVTLFNLGNQALTFRLYATDAVNGSDGEFALLSGSDTPTDVGTWVGFAQDLVTVGPGQVATIPIEITIPDDADPGDHVGGVVASSEAVSSNEDGAAVVLERRTGPRLYVRVGGPLRAELAIEDLSVDYDTSPNPFDGSGSVTYAIENRGNVRLGGTSSVSIAGPFGVARVGGGAEPFPEILPGQRIELSADIDGVPALLWTTARVVVEPDPSGEGATLAPVTREATTAALPITLLLLILLVLFGLLAVRAYRRHRSAPLVVAPAGEIVDLDPAAAVDEEELVR